ncbi:glycosyltransferase family 4 protein [Candidatus Giovannonibacteria bacterium]|nr:glycosyltransferase family 4 protein [Candidatus Giovannonibacteria bacterium]
MRGIRRLASQKNKDASKPGNGMRVAMIHNEKRIATGAHHINQIIATALKERGAAVRNFYPRWKLTDAPIHMRGFSKILFFHSLLEHKNEILRYHVIQGTTYTPLPFLSFKTPLVSHFGSTTIGFLRNTPKTSMLLPSEIAIWHELRNLGIISGLELETFRPLRDIADMEKLVATRVTRCIATSEHVRDELLDMGVPHERIRVVHNAIENYWFERKEPPIVSDPHIVFLGRLGRDVFTLKLKGLTRLIGLYRAFPNIPKTTICMTTNKKLKEWLRVAFPVHHMHANIRKDLIPNVLSRRYGSILFISSRYEGFSLSLIEGMSQGLVPISYAVGVAPEIIKNGENGFLVSSNEKAQEKVKELISNPKKRLAMAGAARKTAEQFRSGIIADKLLGLYREIKIEHDQRAIL